MNEESQWIQAVLSGNKQAYAHIINKYKNRLYATILRMTQHPQKAEDLVQEALIKAYLQLDKFDGKGPFSSWLYRVAINHCLDELRKKRYQMIHVEVHDFHLQNQQHPEVIFLQKEKNRQLERLISSLPNDERLIILLRYVNELSYKEISEIMDVSLSTVRINFIALRKK